MSTSISPIDLPVILVLDDDGLDLWMPGLILRRYGFVVFEASTTQQIHDIQNLNEIGLVFFNPLIKSCNYIDAIKYISKKDSENKKFFVNYSYRMMVIDPVEVDFHASLDKPVKSASQIFKLISDLYPFLSDRLSMMERLTFGRIRGRRRTP